jgi:hypothetical protein
VLVGELPEYVPLLPGDPAVTRRRYLIAYDVAEPRRLCRICSIMESYGERLPSRLP